MITLKVLVLMVAALIVKTSSATERSNQSPSNPTQLPSDLVPSVPPDSKGQRDEKPKRAEEPGKSAQQDSHRLSKRFISPRWSLKRSDFSPDTSFRSWSADGVRLPISLDLSRPRYYELLDDPDISDLLDYDKSKRFIGLLPAKEPRRKDLPPRIGEESAPRFARAFSFPDNQEDFPSVRTTLSGLLRKLKSYSRYRGNVPGDYLDHRNLLAQRFRIDTPININHAEFSFGVDEDIPVYSSIESPDYSSGIAESGIAGDFDQDSSSEVAGEIDEDLDNQRGSSANREEDLTKFKESLHKLLAHTQQISQVGE